MAAVRVISSLLVLEIVTTNLFEIHYERMHLFQGGYMPSERQGAFGIPHVVAVRRRLN